MGLEAECTVRVGRKTSSGRALLETEVLLFRGEGGPFKVPFDEIRQATVDGDDLVITTAEREVRFGLGAAVAERWLRMVKEPKGLLEKLELGPQSRIAVVDVSDSLFLAVVRERIAGVAEGRVPEGAPVVFLGVETREGLRRLPLLRARMIPTGILWIVRPKGGKAISERDVFEAVRSNGLVDVKVVAFSRTHTAHKCIIPLELRGRPVRPPPILSIPPSAPTLPSAAKAPRPPAARPRPATPAKKAKAARADKPVKKPSKVEKKKGKGKKEKRKKEKKGKKDKKGKRRK